MGSQELPAGGDTYISSTMISLLLLLGLATSSPVPKPNQLQTRVSRETRGSSNLVLVTAREGHSLAQSRQDIEDVQVPAGEAVDIFYRYGFFSLSVRVVPRDDHGSWIIREPTTKIFTPGSIRQVKTSGNNKFQSQFQIFFCDDLNELMQHYFHDFTAEGVREPHRLYTGSWRTPTIVKYFGLSDDTLHSDSGFVLVKLVKERVEVKTEGIPVLKSDAQTAFNRIRVGDEKSVKDFFENYGSHYIRSLTIGDAVYQILALDRPQYNRAKNDVLVEKKVSDFTEIYDNYLAPWIVRESGRVQAASGDDRVAEFLDERVIMRTQFSNSPSIFEIRKDERLLNELEVLTRSTEAVVALAFRSIGALLPSVQAQDYYNEIVNTILALWEVNI